MTKCSSQSHTFTLAFLYGKASCEEQITKGQCVMMKLRLCVQNNSKHSKSNYSENKLANAHVNHLIEMLTEFNDLSSINFYSKT